MNHKAIFYVYYYPSDNIFTDEDGKLIYNMYDLITPRDLYLFRHLKKYKCFPLLGHSDVLCLIIEMEPYNDFEYEDYLDIDFGDDYERLLRYEEAKLTGVFN